MRRYWGSDENCPLENSLWPQERVEAFAAAAAARQAQHSHLAGVVVPLARQAMGEPLCSGS